MLEKKVWGRKRHLLVDTQGWPLLIKVGAADIPDRVGARHLLSAVCRQAFPRLQVIWVDQGYTGPLKDWIKEHLGCRLEVVRQDWTWELIDGLPRPVRKKPKGFAVLPKRWIVERTFAWITRHRRLARDFEGLPQSSEAFIQLAASRLMLSRLVSHGS